MRKRRGKEQPNFEVRKCEQASFGDRKWVGKWTGSGLEVGREWLVGGGVDHRQQVGSVVGGSGVCSGCAAGGGRVCVVQPFSLTLGSSTLGAKFSSS